MPEPWDNEIGLMMILELRSVMQTSADLMMMDEPYLNMLSTFPQEEYV